MLFSLSVGFEAVVCSHLLHKCLCKIFQLLKIGIRRVDNAREGLGSSEMLTINLHGIGRHTRRLGPGISIYLKSVGYSISSLDYIDVQSTQYQHQISYAVVLSDGVCDPFIIVLEVYGLFLLATGI